jgi:hypothetical protein
MPDPMTRLAALHDGPPAAVDDAAIASDLRRGRDARVTRGRRRAGAAGAAALGVVAVSSLSYALASGGSSRAPQAVVPHTVVPRTVVRHTPGNATSTSKSTPAFQLMDYRGRQLPGYTVKQVPRGYVLQGISGSVLDIAASGDHSPLDSFDGKLVVMLNDFTGPTTGTPVSVSGHPGRISDQDGVLALTYSDGTHNVDVQSWSNIHLSRDQLVQFAEGVTVLPSAQVGHG